MALGTDQQRLMALSRNHTGWPVLATSTGLSALSMTPGEDAGPEVVKEGPGSTPWLLCDMSLAISP